MRKCLILILCICLTYIGNSQTHSNETASFADTIIKYFDYDTLRQIPCTRTPPGVYSIAFRVRKKELQFDLLSTSDSLEPLRTLFISVIKRSASKMPLRKRSKKYLQIFYFNTLLGCNSNSDTVSLSNNIYRDVSKILGYQLSSIEDSFRRLLSIPGNYYILLPVIINDNNPAIRPIGRGFKNDIKQRTFTPKEIEIFEKMIQKTKQDRIKNRD